MLRIATRWSRPVPPYLPQKLDQALLRRGVRALRLADPRLARLVAANGIPPLWSRPGGFRTLARIVLEQQVSLGSAATLFRRVDRTLTGGVAVGPILRAGRPGLRALGLTRQKSDYFVSLAEEVESGRLDLRGLHRLNDADAHDALTQVHGIGPWTASVYLLMVLQRPDVWPPGDLALHVALARLRGQNRVPTSAEAERHARRWRPWRSVAARILWHAYLSERSGRGAGGGS